MKRNRLTASLLTVLLAASILVTAVSRSRPAASRGRVEVRPKNLSRRRPAIASLPVPEVPAATKSLAIVQIENRLQDASPERIERGLCDLLTARLANAERNKGDFGGARTRVSGTASRRR